MARNGHLEESIAGFALIGSIDINSALKGTVLREGIAPVFRRETLEGLRGAVPIVLGYFPMSVAFGLLSTQVGLGEWEAILMSALVYAGASQFVAVQLFGGGLGSATIVLTTFIVNLRHLLMSSSLSHHFRKIRRSLLPVIAFGITDETFAVSSLRFPKKEASAAYSLVLNFSSYASWIGGTVLGVFVGVSLPPLLSEVLPFALPAMFIALLVLRVSRRLDVLVAGVAAILSSTFYFLLPGAWDIMLATVFAATLGGVIERWRKGPS